MATTTNFGWETPDDTDLVKDGAAAMRTLGNSIDTSFVDLKGGTTGQILSKASNTDLDYTWITNDVGDITAVTAGTGISGGGSSGAVTITNDMATTITASGDIVVGTGSGTYDNLPIGTTGQVLTADTTVSPYKVKWATTSAAAQSFSLLGTGSLTGAATITVSGISAIGTIYVLVAGASSANASSAIGLRINTDTGNNYYRYGPYVEWATTYNDNFAQNLSSSSSSFNIGNMAGTASSVVSGYAVINGCNSAGKKMINAAGGGDEAGNTSPYMFWLGGYYDSSSTVSSISLVSSSGNFDAGNFYVYGSA